MLAPWKKSYDKPRQLLKSRDISLLTKVHIIKVMVFPVVMYGFESSTSSTLVQFSSVTKSCPTLCDPMNHSTPGLPVHHQLPELPKFMSIESVMPSNHLILCCPLLLLPSIFPSIRVFAMSWLFAIGGQSIGTSA